jgi:hypothetical protein
MAILKLDNSAMMQQMQKSPRFTQFIRETKKREKIRNQLLETSLLL